MILGRDIFTGLKIDLCFSDNTIKENGGACKGCIAPMKDITNILLSAKSHYNNFCNEELCKSRHVPDATRCVLCAHYKKYDIYKVTSNLKINR